MTCSASIYSYSYLKEGKTWLNECGSSVWVTQRDLRYRAREREVISEVSWWSRYDKIWASGRDLMFMLWSLAKFTELTYCCRLQQRLLKYDLPCLLSFSPHFPSVLQTCSGVLLWLPSFQHPIFSSSAAVPLSAAKVEMHLYRPRLLLISPLPAIHAYNTVLSNAHLSP